MKKKLVTAMTAVMLVMILCVPMAVQAASPIAGNCSIVEPPTGGVANAALVGADMYTPQNVGAVATIADKAGIAKGYMILDIADISYVDITTGAAVAPPAGMLIRVEAPGVATTDRVIVMHILSDNSVQYILATCGTDYFTFHTDSFSTFAFLFYKDGNVAGGSTGSNSPQTGVYA